jgi:ubiquinone/menaquinone biosynthesis C-methylase UbiE
MIMRANPDDLDLSRVASKVIRSIGIKSGQSVLDFGCGSGIYAIPVARVVGNRGKVYALDKNREVLDNVMKSADSAGLDNIRKLDTPGGTQIALANDSVDVVLLFDVFHDYYFSSAGERQDLLVEIRRILKKGGILSVYPKHMETEAKAEIESAGFSLENQLTINLVHDKTDIERGRIMNFKKELAIDNRVGCEKLG